MTSSSTPPNSQSALWENKRFWSANIELVMKWLLRSFAYFSIFITAGITIILVYETLIFLKEVPIWRLFTETEWSPLFAEPKFGIIVIIMGTLLTSVIAMAVAIPLGLLSAIYLSEFAPPKVRSILKPLLEILAGVPTVVYGFFALLFVTPLLQATIFPEISGLNALSAGLVMGIAILPLVASLSEDALYAVPQLLREGSYALGATKYETIWGVLLPSALSGIVSSFILAVSRAVGETMIVALAAGQSPILTFNPLDSVMTITAFIVQVVLGDAPSGSLAFQTIFAAGFTLFLMTLVLNILADIFVRRYRLNY